MDGHIEQQVLRLEEALRDRYRIDSLWLLKIRRNVFFRKDISRQMPFFIWQSQKAAGFISNNSSFPRNENKERTAISLRILVRLDEDLLDRLLWVVRNLW